MSKRDWGHYIATGLSAVLTIYAGTFIASWVAGEGIFGCNKAKQYSAEGSSKVIDGFPITPLRVGAEYEEPNCTRPKNKDYADLCQQRRMADSAAESGCYAGWQTFFALLGLLGVGGTVYFAWKAVRYAKEAASSGRDAAKHARDSAEVARDALIASQRAWIRRIRVSPGPLHIDDGGATTTIAIEMRNVGNAPALHVSMHAWLFAVTNGEIPTGRAMACCDALRTAPFMTGFMLFPDESYPNSNLIPVLIGCQLSGDIIKSASQGPGSYIGLCIGGCIDYTFPSDMGVHHQTSFFMEIESANGPISVSSGTVPSEKLRLQNIGFYGTDRAD